MNVNLHPDDCKDYHFFSDWIKGKLLAVHDLQTKFNSTARNRLNYCKKLGYNTHGEGLGSRNSNLPDIYEINTSAEERQGKPMNPAYFEYPKEVVFNEFCQHHYFDFIGVFHPDTKKMVAYTELYFIGEFVNISRILGHKDYLKDGIMLYLIELTINLCKYNDTKALIYNQWESGTEGLKYFKHSTGFKPMQISEL